MAGPRAVALLCEKEHSGLEGRVRRRKIVWPGVRHGFETPA
jgi:hypothetical protein